MGRDSELFKAAKTGNTALLERAFASYLKKTTHSHVFGSGLGSIRKSANPNIQDEAGYTLLHHATLNGQRETVSLLIKCGASTMIPDSSGSCPLHLAAWKGDMEIVSALVQQGPSRANVNHQSDSDDTALHLASQYGYSDVVEFLLERHANPLLTNIKGETPLDLAAQYGHLETVHLLISHCPEVLHLTRTEFSPLHLAARNGHTVVALSLINAGISVNTVCERGTALHEAAMCGKTETVQLFLDKGTNLELKDSKGRTVVDLLGEYCADIAKKIRTMIQEHVENCRKSGIHFDSQRIIAVAQTSCNPVLAESSALAFQKGDSIEVQRKTSKDVFIGSLNGRTGSFLAKDVTFFQEEEKGQLVPTDVSILRCPSSSPCSSVEQSPEPQQRNKPVKYSVVTKPPYEHLPGFPCRDSVSTETSEVDTEPSISAHQGEPDSLSEQGTEGDKDIHKMAVPGPIQKRMSGKEKRFQLRKDDGSYSELQPISPLEAKRQYGESLRLNPVGPAFGSQSTSSKEPQTVTAHNTGPPEHEQQEEGDNSFMGSYYVLEVGNFNDEQSSEVQVTPPPVPDSEGYYMLDIRNLEELSMSQSQEATGEAKPVGGGREQNNYENVKRPRAPKNSSEGLYDTPRNVARRIKVVASKQKQDYTNIELPSSSSSSSSSPPLTYENIQLTSAGREVQQPSVPAPSAPIGIPARETTDKGSSRSLESSSQGRGSSTSPSYENIELSPSQKQSVGSDSHVKDSHEERLKTLSPHGSDRVHTRENGYASSSQGGSVDLPREGQMEPASSDGVLRTSKQEHPQSDGNIKHVSKSPMIEKKRKSAIRREEIYEPIRLGVKNETTKTVQLAPSKPSTSQHKEPLRSSPGSEVNGHHGNGEPEAPVVTEGHNLAATKSDSAAEKLKPHLTEKERSLTGGNTKIVDSEDPFAGLVLSASKQLEEGEGAPGQSNQSELSSAEHGQSDSRVEVSPLPLMRERLETLWDDDRVQREWSQIDTLLQDVSGNLPASNPVTREQSPPSNPVTREQSPPSNQSGKLFKWLLGLGLGGYTSALESSGFDNLAFLSGSILAMDDLSDIGITDQEDQYNIMAATNLLPPPPRVRQASSVAEWLALLHLDHLATKFTDYTLQKLSTLWDIELASVVGIELLGYRKRLQYGIAELRCAHPEWLDIRWSTSSSPSTSRSSLPLQDNAVSLYRDYRNIKSTASPRSSRVELEVPQDNKPSVVVIPDSEVVVRPPKVAQGKIAGIMDRECTLPSDTWQHPTTALLKESISYKSKYLGSVIVKRVHGVQSTEEACLRLRTSTENMKKFPEIILSISWKGVKFVDAHSKMVVSTHVIRDISYCSQDIEDKRVFAYITKDKSGMNYCHVFMAASEEIAGEIMMTIAQAFEITYQKVMKARIVRKGRQDGGERRSKHL